MNDQLLKWLVEQSDRGLFIIALAGGGWLFWRVLKRSETQTDSLLEAMRAQRDQHHAQMTDTQNKLFENCADVSSVVALNTAAAALNTAATERNSRLLERVEQKL